MLRCGPRVWRFRYGPTRSRRNSDKGGLARMTILLGFPIGACGQSVGTRSRLSSDSWGSLPIMAFDKRLLLTTTIVAGMAAFAPAALAQTNSGQTTSAAGQPTTDPEDEATELDEVVVTGSRIRRDAYSSTSPIEVITNEESTLEGLVDAGEILQGSTAASTAAQINNTYTGFLTTGGPGVNTLSLRGLGAQRTLVLLNGRRIGPAGARGTVGPVDLNVIPASQVERYELLLDGASSIYGSDAIAGVVNVITPTSVDGGYMEAYASVPFDGGGEEYTINGRYGKVFDRGYANIAAEYYNRESLTFRDRDICPEQFVFADEDQTVRRDVIDPATGDFKCLFRINNMVRNFAIGFGAGPNRSGDYQPDTSARYGGGYTGCDINGWRQVGGGAGTCSINARPTDVRRAATGFRDYQGDPDLDTTIVSPAERYTLSAFAGYDLTDNIEAFAELLWNRRESSQYGARQIFPSVSPFHTQNPFGGPCNLLNNAGGNTDCMLSLAIPEVGYGSRQEIDYYRAVVGVRGDFDLFGRQWDFELAGQYSRSDAKYESDMFYNDRVEATAGAAALFGTNLAGDYVGERNFGDSDLAGYPGGDNDNCDEAILISADDCPAGGVNWFDPVLLATGQGTANWDWLQFVSLGETEYIQKYVEGVVSGELFELPAGPVGMALGFHIREDEIDDNPDDEEERGNLWGFSAAGRTQGSDTVKEIFGEVELPLLADLPLVNELTLNLSGRLSDYDSYGENSTYKVGLNWRITPEFRIRASNGTSFRAPALYELFLADQTGFAGQLADPCINYQDSTNTVLQQNCAADGVPEGYTGAGGSSIEVTTGGGRDVLEAEDGENLTVGFIYTPDFLDFSFALDYFNTTIENQVDQIGVGGILFGCYTSPTFPNDPLCTLFERNKDPSSNRFNQILTVNDSYVNISEQSQEGLDLSVRYTKEFSFGDLTLNARVSHILNFEIVTFADTPADNLTDNVGNPKTVGNANARFETGDWTFYYDVNWTGSASDERFFANTNATTYFGEPVFADYDVDDYFVHSVSVQREYDDWTFLAGVRNVFDADVPEVTNGFIGNYAFGSQYDYVGRRFFVSVSKDF